MSLYQASILAKLKLIGVWYVSPFENEGGVGDVLERDVIDAQSFIATQDNTSNLLTQLDVRVNDVRNAIGNNSLISWNSVVLALGVE